MNLKKSELVLDLALIKPTQDRWMKLQEMFCRLSSKSVISARTLMSTIGLLASMEKTVKLGRIHMRPFQWHTNPLESEDDMTWGMVVRPKNMLQGEFLHPREHKKLYL